MKESVSFSRFSDAFQDYNRDSNFSYEGKRALYDWLEEYEDSTGEEQELDVIALCCDFTEWESLKEFNDNHSIGATCLVDIEQHTTVIKIDDDRFITQAF